MKKILLLLLSASLILMFMAGCGQKEEPKTEEPAMEEPVEETMEDTMAAPDTTMMEEEPAGEASGN
jgi:hypothetical protein